MKRSGGFSLLGVLGVGAIVVIVLVFIIIPAFVVFFLLGGPEHVAYWLGAYKTEEKLLRASPYGDKWIAPEGWLVRGYNYHFKAASISDLSGDRGLRRVLVSPPNSSPDKNNSLVEKLPSSFVIRGKKDIEVYPEKLRNESYKRFSGHQICGYLGELNYPQGKRPTNIFIKINYTDPNEFVLLRGFMSGIDFKQQDFIKLRDEGRYIAIMSMRPTLLDCVLR